MPHGSATRCVCVVVVATGVLAPLPAGASPTPMCFGEPATIVGTSDPEYLEGTPGPDVIVAKAGKDYIEALGGNDLVCAGEGGSGNLLGEMEFSVGGPGADRLSGGGGYDALIGSAGGDIIFGDAGHDHVVAGDGKDVVRGGDGHDWMEGNADSDTLLGQADHDALLGGPGADLLDGGKKGDAVLFDGATDPVYVNIKAGVAKGQGSDTLRRMDDAECPNHEACTLIGDGGRNEFWGSSKSDVLKTAGGKDWLHGMGGDDVLNGGMGLDRIGFLTYPVVPVMVDLAAGRAEQGSDVHKLVGIEESTATEGPDVLLGDGGPNKLFAWLGDDLLKGRGGNDFLDGGQGDDEGDGGPGQDTCKGIEDATSCVQSGAMGSTLDAPAQLGTGRAGVRRPSPSSHWPPS